MNKCTKDTLRVGVTLHLREGHQSIWENGAFQNVVFLVQLLQHSPLVAEAVVVINRDEPVALPDDMLLAGQGIRLITLPEAMQTLDVVVEMSALLSEEWLEAFQSQGGRNAWMRVGNDYVIDIERAMNNLAPGSLCSRKKVSAVWTIPEYEKSCADYFALTTRAPVFVLPHLWTPLFIDQGCKRLPQGIQFGYQPGRGRWRLVIAEPNLCMVKTSLVPMMVAENYYRKLPHKVEIVRVLNSGKLRKHQPFVQMAQMLDIVKHEVASFDDRLPLYEVLATQGDAVISHHWENGQNYLYYEVLYGGYPLIHNSEFIGDAGYCYPGFNAGRGAHALHNAVQNHDADLATYRHKANEFLKTLDVAYAPNIQAYHEALQQLLA